MIVYRKGVVDEAFIIKTINDKLAENHRIKRLQEYYRGEHDILRRQYEDKTKPNNRIPVNYMQSVADFLTAYLTGVPIEYQNAPEVVIDLLNYNDNDSTTQSINLNMNICGYGVELFYTDEDGIPRFNSIDPIESIFIFNNSLQQTMTHFIRVYPKDDEAEGYYVTVYDSEGYTEYELTAAVGELKVLQGHTPHYWQDVPATLYPNNDWLQGSFEQLIPLQDALNKVTSDNVNDFESFVDAYLVLENMKAATNEDLANMKRDRVLLTDADSKAYWLTKTADVQYVEQLRTDLVTHIRELGKFPDITDISGLGSSGIALQMRLIPTEMQASKQERILFKGIQRKLELLYNVLNLTDKGIGRYTEVEPKFSRNFLLDTISDKERADTISTMLMDGYITKRKAAELNPLIATEEIDGLMTDIAIEELGVADATFPLDTEGGENE